MIKFDNVSVRYVEEFISLFNFSHTFEGNTLLVGDNLSGANTILRLIAKFDKSYDGSIFINNINLKQTKDKNINLAFVSKEPCYFKFRSLEYNLSYPLKIRKLSKVEIKEKTNNFISEFLGDFPKKMRKCTLSQNKIICLARAVLRQPKILLLEYFFDDLDSSYVELACNIIKNLNKDCLILACENKLYDCFKDFKVLNFSFGSLV